VLDSAVFADLSPPIHERQVVGRALGLPLAGMVGVDCNVFMRYMGMRPTEYRRDHSHDR
jgi:hypothetical protein